MVFLELKTFLDAVLLLAFLNPFLNININNYASRPPQFKILIIVLISNEQTTINYYF